MTTSKATKKAVKKKVCTDCGCEKAASESWEISEYELRYYHDHIPPDLRKEFDRIEKEQGKAAAFGYTLQRVLSDMELTVHLPEKNVTVMSKRATNAAIAH